MFPTYDHKASEAARPVYGPSGPELAAASPTWRDLTEHQGRTFVTISIGRNLHSDDSRELPARAWRDFRDSVRALFATVEFTVSGLSDSNEHSTEETYIVGGWIDHPSRARRALSLLVETFDQDAAAWVEGGERIEAAR